MGIAPKKNPPCSHLLRPVSGSFPRTCVGDASVELNPPWVEEGVLATQFVVLVTKPCTITAVFFCTLPPLNPLPDVIAG
jgi:hypothetical protein